MLYVREKHFDIGVKIKCFRKNLLGLVQYVTQNRFRHSCNKESHFILIVFAVFQPNTLE